MTPPNDQQSFTSGMNLLTAHQAVCDLCLANKPCPRASQLLLESLRIKRDQSVQDQPLVDDPEIDMPPAHAVPNLNWPVPTNQPWWRKLLWHLRGRNISGR